MLSRLPKKLWLALLAVPIFLFLGKLPFQKWDEGRIAINTYEMVESGDLLGVTFGGNPEFWNTKPGLLHWAQYGSVYVFGFNEFGIRFPSAMAGLLTCIVIFTFLQTELKNHWIAIISAFILVGFSGFIGIHSARTCEYDALLSLFTTLAAISFYRAVEYSNRYLYLFFLFISLAALTKGIASLMFLPPFLLFALFRKKVVEILISKSLYLGLFGFLLLVGSYYLGREHVQPGYLNAVYQNELGGRFGETIEDHQGSFFFYFVTLKNSIPFVSLFVLPIGIILGLKSKDERVKTVSLFSTVLFFSFTFILGLAGTKLDWYFTPVYPFVAILVSTGIKEAYAFLALRTDPRTIRFRIARVVFLVILCVIPYIQAIDRAVSPKYSHQSYGIGDYLSNALHEESAPMSFDVLWDGYDAQHRIYVMLLQDQGHTIGIASPKDIQLNERYMVSQKHLHEYITQHYTFQKEEIDKYVTIYTLESYVE